MQITRVKNRVQIYNPKGRHWVKLNASTGQILSYKKTPYKRVKQIKS